MKFLNFLLSTMVIASVLPAEGMELQVSTVTQELTLDVWNMIAVKLPGDNRFINEWSRYKEFDIHVYQNIARALLQAKGFPLAHEIKALLERYFKMVHTSAIKDKMKKALECVVCENPLRTYISPMAPDSLLSTFESCGHPRFYFSDMRPDLLKRECEEFVGDVHEKIKDWKMEIEFCQKILRTHGSYGRKILASLPSSSLFFLLVANAITGLEIGLMLYCFAKSLRPIWAGFAGVSIPTINHLLTCFLARKMAQIKIDQHLIVCWLRDCNDLLHRLEKFKGICKGRLEKAKKDV